MAYQLEEDDFSDSGFDALPANTLHQLEHDAVRLSQQPHPSERQAHQSVVPHGRPNGQVYAQQRQQYQDEDQPMHEPPSSDYGFDDEDVVDLDDPSLSFQPQSRVPIQGNAYQQDSHDTYTVVADGQEDLTEQDQEHYRHELTTEVNVGQLQTRIIELERERVKLQKSVEDARSDAMAKAGANAILRSKHEKATTEYERKLALMQSLHAEESAKQRTEIEATRKERETVKTNNRFLEHDLAQEIERAKRLKGPTSNAVTRSGSRGDQRSNTTPKKQHQLPFRDGFDDNEIIRVSPSKSRERTKAETPKAGGKRKRPVDASPIPLAFNQAHASPLPDVEGAVSPDVSDRVHPRALNNRASDLRTMQRVLNHAPAADCVRTLELLAKYAFPSAPQDSVSSLFLQSLACFSQDEKESSLSLHVCGSCMDIWERCLAEAYYAPLHLVLDLLEFVLISETMSVHVMIIDRLIPLATKAIDLVALPLATASRNSLFAAALDKTAQTKLQHDIDVNLILGLLHTSAMSASQSPENTKDFWQAMEFDFVLMMLNKAQPLPQIMLVLQMVGGSVLPDSFGTIKSDIQKRERDETSTIDRLTSLLFERPDPPASERPYDPSEISRLRITILGTLSVICLSDHGSMAVAQHRTAIGRLIRFLDQHINFLYSVPIAEIVNIGGDMREVPTAAAVHGLTTTCVNLTARLLYHLLHSHTEIINLREKCAVIPGGHQKFLIAFTRLAFSEQLVLEAGIDEEVIDGAHEILDAVLTPEEGEAIVKAFETPSRSNATRGSISLGASAPD